MTIKVAIAGASTGFGKTLVDTFVLLNQENDNPYHFIVLSRNANAKLTTQGIDVRTVDYTSHEQLVASLSGVHTVISTIGGTLKDNTQFALLAAAKEAGVKRFAPSEYAGKSYEGIDLYASKAKVWEAVQQSGLEYTRFSCGIFMSAFATGTPKPLTVVGEREGRTSGEEEALAGLRPWNFIVNMKAGTADLPGDGTQPVVFTEMRDIARFVFLALGLKQWPPELGMQGDVKSFREVVEMAEKVQGRKWLLKENSPEQLQQLAETDNPGVRFYNQARLMLATEGFLVGDELNLAFSEVKPVTCEQFLEKWWAGVQLGEASWSNDHVPL